MKSIQIILPQNKNVFHPVNYLGLCNGKKSFEMKACACVGAIIDVDAPHFSIVIPSARFPGCSVPFCPKEHVHELSFNTLSWRICDGMSDRSLLDGSTTKLDPKFANIVHEYYLYISH